MLTPVFRFTSGVTAHTGSLLTLLLFTQGCCWGYFLQGLLLTQRDTNTALQKCKEKFPWYSKCSLKSFKDGFCHKGSSQIHFPTAHIKGAEVLIICDTSHDPVYVTGEKVEGFFATHFIHVWCNPVSSKQYLRRGIFNYSDGDRRQPVLYMLITQPHLYYSMCLKPELIHGC